MPGARLAPAASRAKMKKHTSIVTTGSPVSPSIPCAMVLTVSFALSPVTGLFCHRRFAGITLANLSASVGAPGPHDFAVRTNTVRPRKRIALGDVRPSHPLPNVRDDRDTPLLWAGTAQTVSLIWGKREAEYFCAKGWTGFRTRRFFCPSGKSVGSATATA